MDLYDWRNQKPQHFEELWSMLMHDDPLLQELRPLQNNDGMNDYPLDDVEAGRLGICLKGNTNLKELSLALHPNLTARGARMLASGIRQSQITKLGVRNDVHIDSLLMSILYEEGVQKSQSLGDLGVTGAVGNYVALCKTFSSLKELHLSGCNLRHKIQTFGASLSSTTTLQTIELYGCSLRNREMVILSAGLRENSSVKRLDLECNEIGDDGVAAFIENWKEDSPMEEISFAYTNVTADGAIALIQAAKSHPSIVDLDVGCNDFGFDGMQRVAEALSHVRLKKFDMTGNTATLDSDYEELTEESQKAAAVATAQAMLSTIYRNPHLHQFNTDCNCFPEELQDEMDLYLDLNKCGRYLLTEVGIPPALWSLVWEFENPDSIYFFLREQPHLMLYAANRVTSRKRKPDGSMLDMILESSASKIRRTDHGL